MDETKAGTKVQRGYGQILLIWKSLFRVVRYKKARGNRKAHSLYHQYPATGSIRKLGFSTKKTMLLAQQLYECGCGEGSIALVLLSCRFHLGF